MKRLKVTILLIVSVLILACVASAIAYKIPYQYHEQLSLYDPVSGETMTADFSIQEKPYFFTESLTHVRWKNELGNFFNTLDDDAIIFKKCTTSFIINCALTAYHEIDPFSQRKRMFQIWFIFNNIKMNFKFLML